MRLFGEVWRDNPTKKRLLFQAKWPCLKSTREIWKLVPLRKEQATNRVFIIVSVWEVDYSFVTHPLFMFSMENWIRDCTIDYHYSIMRMFIQNTESSLNMFDSADVGGLEFRTKKAFYLLFVGLVSGHGADCQSPLEQQQQSQPLNWLLRGNESAPAVCE